MRRLLCLSALLFAATAALAEDKPKDTMLYELRIYTAAPGKLDALNARFRDHTVKLFEKHGMKNIGYWVPVKNDENKLYYVIAHKDKAARDASFKAFGADPDWQKAAKESEKDGPLLVKVNPIQVVFLTATDYSPAIKPSHTPGTERVFEMRTYTASKGNLDALNARFRDHTVKLFEKHGMTNLAYFTYAPKLNKSGEDVTLLYFLAHKSEDAAKASFDAFRKDADWVAAKEASEKKAGGSLTEKEGGVKSLFLKPTDYSPTK
ncbi:MAG: NIPSNAP family protein [Fimbriiglobus sp.]|jgi:hypothetical protein|nr:NIPSNAP family protein [Fimbriiglobus sp.]